MGAADFRTTAHGKTYRDAFDAAVTQAQYDYGHAGYTGTIAEKSAVVPVSVPDGVLPETFVSWIEEYEHNTEQVPAQHKIQVARYAKIWQDKWGPALAVCLQGDLYVFFGLASD